MSGKGGWIETPRQLGERTERTAASVSIDRSRNAPPEDLTIYEPRDIRPYSDIERQVSHLPSELTSLYDRSDLQPQLCGGS
jgi:hypothetical protein